MYDHKDPMGKTERKLAVLEFLEENDLVLPPKAIHLNMTRRGATFSLNTVQRHLREMMEDGYVAKNDEAESYYQITDKGREWLKTEG